MAKTTNKQKTKKTTSEHRKGAKKTYPNKDGMKRTNKKAHKESVTVDNNNKWPSSRLYFISK